MILKSDIVHSVVIQPGRPQTHAIVIGIGCYPHGQSMEAVKVPDLASPVESARAMADWFLTEFNDPNCPLASLSLLVSADVPFEYTNPLSGQAYEVPTGTTSDILKAVQEWSVRAGANLENRSIFYFCGHGVRSGLTDCLLTRSFGENPLQHMNGVLDANIDTPMRLIGPKRQIYFFDTCRSDGAALLGTGVQPPQVLSVMPGFGGGNLPRVSKLFAAGVGAKAFGRPGGMSLFLEEFFLAGKSAVRRNVDAIGNGWWLNTGPLQAHMQKFIKEQTCQHFGEELDISLAGPQPGGIPVVVFCNPRDSISGVQIACNINGRLVDSFDGGATMNVEEWRLALEHRVHEFSVASCVVGEFESFTPKQIMVYPPFIDVVVSMGDRDII
jgi:hypothetical protein